MTPPTLPRRSSSSKSFIRILVGAVFMLALLCALEVLTTANFRNLAEANRWSIHTYRVLAEISSLRDSLNDEESRLRGFALTKNLEFVTEARRSESAGQDALNELRTLTSNNPLQQVRLQTFAHDYQIWLTRFALLNHDNLDQTATRLKNETVPRRIGIQRLRNKSNQLQSTEQGLLEVRSQQQMSSQQGTAKFLFFASLCTVLVVGFSIVMLGLQTRALEQSVVQLNNNREQLQTILDNAPLVLYAVDTEEKFTMFAGRGLENIGLAGVESVGRPVAEVLGSDYNNIDSIRAALAGKSSVSNATYRGHTFEGHRRPLLDENGQIVGMIGVSLDITERYEAEHASRESEARYRSVVEGVQEVIFQMDEKGNWTFLNPAWRLLLGHNVVASMAHPCLEFVYPEDRQTFHDSFDSLAQSSTNISRLLIRFTTRNGAPRWMDTQIQAQHDVHGRFVGAAGTLNDITDRKLAQEELLGAMTLQKAILNSANYTIIACNTEGIIQSFNRAAQEMLGYTAEEMCGKRTPLCIHDENEVAAVAKELSEELGTKIEPGFETFVAKPRRGLTEEREWIYVRRDGTRFPVRLSISPFYGAEGEITGFVGIGYDLTESRRTEKLKNEFVSVVSHELRTPLTSIRGALGLLSGGVAGPLPESARQMIDIAQKNSDRLVLLINDILDIEKIESGKMRFDSRPLALHELVTSAIEQNRAYGAALGVKLVFEGKEHLDVLQVMGDEDRLQQVLSNLLSNAAKFTPSGGTVHVAVELRGYPPQYYSNGLAVNGISDTTKCIRISVRDEGPGVPPEFVPRLFEKFAQADSSSTRQQGGTGLGLAIARAIVEKHGGVIDYKPPRADDTQQGATFFFDLPIETPESSTEPLLPHVGRVLICEDDNDISSVLSAMVTQSGYQPDIVNTVAAARDCLATNQYIGMTLDLVLPDGDGLELLAELRVNPRHRLLPVVVVTGSATRGKLEGEAFGVLDWLRKPVEAERLLASLGQFRGTTRPSVLHIEDDVDVRRVMAAILSDSADVAAAATLREARALLEQRRFDLAILDIGLPDGSGLDLIPQLSNSEPPIPIILFSASEASHDQANAVAASLVKSRTDNDALRATIERFLQGASETKPNSA